MICASVVGIGSLVFIYEFREIMWLSISMLWKACAALFRNLRIQGRFALQKLNTRRKFVCFNNVKNKIKIPLQQKLI